MSEPPPSRTLEWDEGVASERTLLAWERTAISSLAVAALVLRAGIVYSLLGMAIPLAAVLVVSGIAEWLFGLRIYAEHVHAHDEGAVAHERAIAGLLVITLLAAAGAAILAIAG